MGQESGNSAEWSGFLLMPALNACQRISVPSREPGSKFNMSSSHFSLSLHLFLRVALSGYLSGCCLPVKNLHICGFLAAACPSHVKPGIHIYFFRSCLSQLLFLLFVWVCVCVCFFLFCSVKFNARFCRIFALTTIRYHNRLCIENESSNLMAPHCNQK